MKIHLPIFCFLLIALLGCEPLLPPPTQPEPKTLSLSDPRLAIITDQAFSCEERRDQLAYLHPCDSQTNATGREAHCMLDTPLESLAFSCGPHPEKPAPILRINAIPGEEALLLELTRQIIGDCKLEDTPNPAQDPVSKACFFTLKDEIASLESAFLTWPQGEVHIPSGLFLECHGERCQSLVLDTTLLEKPQQKLALRMIPTLLSLSDERSGPTEP